MILCPECKSESVTVTIIGDIRGVRTERRCLNKKCKHKWTTGGLPGEERK